MNTDQCHPSVPRQNHLLAALPDADWKRWQPQLEFVELTPGQVLCGPNVSRAHVIFPTTAVVSMMYVTQEGEPTEFAVVGNDGVVGFSLFMGGNATACEAVVQTAGQGFRLPAQVLDEEVNCPGPVLHLMLRYTQSMIAQVAQTALCNRYHSIDQQVSRRLLMGLDRSASNELTMTQEGVAHLLGVRREGVTAAAQRLQEAGVIRYSRGRIGVLDRHRLEQRSCECYTTVRREYSRLLPNPALARDPQSFAVMCAAPRSRGEEGPILELLTDTAIDGRAINRALPPRASARHPTESPRGHRRESPDRVVAA